MACHHACGCPEDMPEEVEITAGVQTLMRQLHHLCLLALPVRQYLQFAAVVYRGRGLRNVLSLRLCCHPIIKSPWQLCWGSRGCRLQLLLIVRFIPKKVHSVRPRPCLWHLYAGHIGSTERICNPLCWW